MDVLVTFTLCLASSLLLAELFFRMGYPRVLGQILAGIILGLPLFRPYLFPAQSMEAINFLAEIGLVFFILLTGMSVRLHGMKRVRRQAALVSIISFFTPFTLGFIFATMMGYPKATSLILGMCLSITAEAVGADILMEFDMLRSKIGDIIVEAGMIDDVLGLISLTAVISYVNTGNLNDLLRLPLEFMIFISIIYFIGFKIYPSLARYIWREKSEIGVFTLSIIFAMIVVILSQFMKLSAIIGAFLAGIVIQLSIKNRREEKEIVEGLRIVTFGLVIPFFFINIGLNFELSYFIHNLPFILMLTVIASIGKFAGPIITSLDPKLTLKEALLVGWGMNSHGAVELVIADIALTTGLIGKDIFSAIVSMALLTTILSPIMFKRTLEHVVYHHKLKTKFHSPHLLP